MGLEKSTLAAMALATITASACGGTTVTPDVPDTQSNTITWSTSIAGGSDAVGATLTFFCPPSGSASTVWGTDVYSDDSSVCTAGVHAGVITLAQGGVVRIVVQPGQASYEASERNGISTSPYGAWGRSFSFAP